MDEHHDEEKNENSPERELLDENSNSDTNPSQNEDSVDLKISDNDSDDNDETMDIDKEKSDKDIESDIENQELEESLENGSDIDNTEEYSSDIEESKDNEKSDESDSEEGETFELENKNNDSDDEEFEKKEIIADETLDDSSNRLGEDIVESNEENVNEILDKNEKSPREDNPTENIDENSNSNPIENMDENSNSTNNEGATSMVEEKSPQKELSENELSDNSYDSKKKSEEESDSLPDFIGFDSTTLINETSKIYQVVREREKKLELLLKDSETKTSDNSLVDEDVTNPEVVPSESNPMSVSSVDEIPQENKVVDEQVASNSKRIKKKRKFFDEFDNIEAEPPKRPNLIKDRENTPSIDSSLSENKENFISTDKISVKDEPVLETTATSSALASSTPISVKPETKGKFDITNPDFKEPFKYGWRREVVYRAISEDGKKRSADVSYFTPHGKKLRSIKQISEHLPSDGSLHVKNFTFSKELVFRNRESELEVTRFTKKMEMEMLTNENELNDTSIERRLGIEAISSNESSVKLKPNLKKKEPPSKSKISKNSKSSGEYRLYTSESNYNKSKSSKKGKNMDDLEESSNATPKLTMPKIMLRGPNVNSNSVPKSVTPKPISMKIKIGPSKPNAQKLVSKKSSKSKSDKSKSQKDKRDANEYNGKSVALTEQRNISPSIKAGISQSKNNRGTPACSISCPTALGTIPTLQCTICLCLFHFQCCGLEADQAAFGYVCKNCRHSERKKENLQLSYKSLHQSTHSPKCLYPVEHYDDECNSQVLIKNTKIVDGVTTWLPSSSNIQLSANSLKNTSTSTLPEAQIPLVQGVLELDGRRYVIVPKQSVLSVSQNASSVTKVFNENHIDAYDRNDDLSGLNVHSIGEVPKLFVNPSDINSAGVVLVPVIPPGSAGASPQQISKSPQYHCKNSSCTDNPAKLSTESNVSTCGRKICDSINGVNEVEMKGNLNECHSSSRLVEYQSSLTLTNISNLYDPLLMSLKYLTVRDLLRVSMANKFLNRIVSDPYLWKTVRLKNSQVHDWEGFARALQKYGTKRLDMRKMLCSTSPDDLTKMWNSFLEIIPSVTSLEHIDFSRSPANVVDTVAATCPNLSIINALYLKSGSLHIENFTKLKNLKDLKLRGISGGIQLQRSEQKLQFINTNILRELSLTSIRNLDMDILEMIGEATNLVSLELGDCEKFRPDFANDTISKLSQLEKLRLEKLQDIAPKYEFLTVVKDMKNLKLLELINIDVKDGFDDALAECKNLEQFLIIPLYVTQSATTNQLIINGIKKLSDTMKCFVWGLTLELLKVTDLFMDQWQLQKGSNNSSAVKKAVGDSIPILKSVDKMQSDGDTVPTHVDILPVPKLEKMLTSLLPQSRIRVLKVPFNMTWRQCLSDSLK